MKKLMILIVLIVIGSLAYVHLPIEEGSYSDVPTNECEKPQSIPDTLYTGEKVTWDCLWQASFLKGNVEIIWKDVDNHDRGAAFLIRKNIN